MNCRPPWFLLGEKGAALLKKAESFMRLNGLSMRTSKCLEAWCLKIDPVFFRKDRSRRREPLTTLELLV